MEATSCVTDARNTGRFYKNCKPETAFRPVGHHPTQPPLNHNRNRNPNLRFPFPSNQPNSLNVPRIKHRRRKLDRLSYTQWLKRVSNPRMYCDHVSRF
jgi:hypothetical protein